MTIDPNSPAFPVLSPDFEDGVVHPGMSLRAYIATAAFAALIGDETYRRTAAKLADDMKKSLLQVIAQASVAYADSLIEELGK